jgi:hypothetical protein
MHVRDAGEQAGSRRDARRQAGSRRRGGRGHPPGLPGDGGHGRDVARVFGRLRRVEQHFHGRLRVLAGQDLGTVAQGADGLAQLARPELDPAARHAVVLPVIGYEVYGKALLGRDDHITPLF